MTAGLADLVFRAGGGFFSGGGGFFFFGGGTGGRAAAGTVWLVTIVLALVMLRALWPRRRRWRRIGGAEDIAPPPPSQDWSHSDQPAISSVQGGLFPGTAAAVAAHDSVDAGLGAISAHDPGFSREVFLQQVQRTFFIVEEAWTKRQPDLSRQVMADGLWQEHKVQIQGYLDGRKRNVLEDLAVGDLTIVGAGRDASYDTIVVRVLASCADYDVDDEHGRVVRGDRHVGQWMEDWTFQRSASAVTPSGGGTMAARCPNCGAPLDLDLAGTCKYCKAPVSSGAYDWVLARIAQVGRRS